MPLELPSKEQVYNKIGGKNGLVVFGVVTVLLIIVIIVFIVYRIKRNILKSADIVTSPRRLFDMSAPINVDAAKLPATSNGQEFTFSFWIFVSSFSVTTDHKLLFMRGGTGTGIVNATPIVYIDKGTNKLYVSIRTTQSANVSNINLVPNRSESRYLTATIEYLPLQRWVNVTFIVQDSLLTLYMDGDIYTVENLLDFDGTSSNRPVFQGLSGNVVVGSVGTTTSTNGYISWLKFFNYALTMNDVKEVYEKGPTGFSSSLMTRMGLPEYGLRSPIYREDSTVTTDSSVNW